MGGLDPSGELRHSGVKPEQAAEQDKRDESLRGCVPLDLI